MKKFLIFLFSIMLIFCVPVEIEAGSTEETYEYVGNSRHRWKLIVNGRVKQKAVYGCSGNPCRWCGHYSSPPHYHNSNAYCGATHCGHRYCTCGSGASHNCGGGCTFTNWQHTSDGVHKGTCSCGRTSSHVPSWIAGSGAHKIKCKTCGLEGSHEPVWKYEQSSDGATHYQVCTSKKITKIGTTPVNINTTISCTAKNDIHVPEFTAPYYKVNGDDSAQDSHRRDCQHSICTIFQSHPPRWEATWLSISDDEHKKECTEAACDLTYIENHQKEYAQIQNDIHYHQVTCENCSYNKGLNETAALHTDNYSNSSGIVGSDGFCDHCSQQLWKVEFEPKKENGLTNQDVTVTVTMFAKDKKDENYEEKKEKVYTKNNLNELESERYEFKFDGVNVEEGIRPVVDHINKTVSGRIKYEPNQPTSGTVKITFLPDYEEETYGDYGSDIYHGRAKKIEARILVNGVVVKDWTDAAINEITYVFEENGQCEIEMRDSLGNGNTSQGYEVVKIPVIVDWIISGQATTATTSDILENGTIFTDILINTDKEWYIDNAQEQISVKIYQIKGNSIERAIDKEALVKINKLEVKDFNENVISGQTIGRGLYYIKTAIGGPGVFTIASEESSTRYILEIDVIETTSGNKLNGENRIEVTVNGLNDLT